MGSEGRVECRGEEPGGPAQGWEDRACPLALPQREAAEDHGNCPIWQLAAQFPLCPLATVEPISRDSPGLVSPHPAPLPLLEREGASRPVLDLAPTSPSLHS